MEGSIEIKESEYNDFRTEFYRGFFGREKMRAIPLGKKKQWTVELTLVPSEEERAIILKYKLDELAVETEPKYTSAQLEKLEADNRQLFAASGETGERIVNDMMADHRAAKEQTLFGYYFNNPYTKSFDVRQDAHTYADKLEKEILPLIKNQIDYYRLEAVCQDKRAIKL